jgi:NADPH:quinone reductase-like Zn-dependent oxidoreductase
LTLLPYLGNQQLIRRRLDLKAVRIHGHGSVEKLVYEAAPDLKLTLPTDAIVRLKAASLSPTDIHVRRGLTGTQIKFPHILGGGGAGIVSEVGEQATNIQPGDAVCLYPASGCGRCEFCTIDQEFMCIGLRVLGEQENGTYAEYLRLPARNCFPLPAGLSFEEAAVLASAATTAWRMLVTNAELKPGEHVLIVGVGNGIAMAALQLAVQMGAHVIVTSSNDEQLERAKNLGAEHGINDLNADFSREVRQLTRKRGVDVAIDCIGGAGWVKSLASLAKGGRLATCGATAGANPQTDLQRIFWNNLKIFGSMLGSRAEFKRALEFMAASKPIIDHVFPLQDAAAAQQRLEQGMQFGNIVLRMDD